jgi:bifunctional ADP-heptose synthase (sugar kinase/adenylyltransferase)
MDANEVNCIESACMLSLETIETILQTIRTSTVVLVGDLFLDRYLEFDPALTEPSLETGLDALQITRVRSAPGALGTIINNLEALGVGKIVPITLIGDDGEGYELIQALKRMNGIELDGIIQTDQIRTPTYTKLMRRELNGTFTEWHRLDTKNRTPTSTRLEAALLQQIRERLDLNASWLILDQVSEANCGVITDQIREGLCEAAKPENQKNGSRFFLADSRERIAEFHDVSVKPNLRECLGPVEDPTREQIDQRLNELFSKTRSQLFCTSGELGIYLKEASDQPATLIPGYPVHGPIDIVGAGDSCSAGIACAITSGFGAKTAAAFGNLIASITVQKIGTTGTASPAEVIARWHEIQGTR